MRQGRRPGAAAGAAAGGALAVAALLFGCSADHPEYRVGNRQYDRQLVELLALLDRETGGAEQRFVIVQEISKVLRAAGAPRRALLFLTTYVEQHPADVYNAVYLMAAAEGYRELEAAPQAAHYYERALDYPDALVAGRSIHLASLSELIALERDPRRLAELYEELIDRFRGAIDPGRSHFYLARAYEALGEWEQAVGAYRVYLQHATAIPGFPNVHREILDKVNFHFSDKSWVMEDLDSLVAEIKRAIGARDLRALNRLRSKSGFFTMSWEQQVADESAAQVFDLAAFALARVRFDAELDPDSNANEAFLRTTGWSHRVRTWYLYFRRIDFKADPEIDGRWEWSGIFLGEKL